MSPRSETRGRFFPAAAVVLAAGVLFFDLLRGQVLFWRDIHALFFVYREALIQAVRDGGWPLWHEGHGFGQPLLAPSDAQILYPTTWLTLLFSPWVSYGIAAFLHLLFTGAGMYRLARRLGLARPAATLSACAWMASGPLLSLVNVQHHYAGAAWIPWVVLAAHRALAEPSGRAIVLAAVAMAMQVLAGSGEMSIVTGLIVAGFAVAQAWQARDRATAVRVVALLAGIGALALLLSAPQWMPTVEIARRSERWKFDQEFRTYWSLHPLATPELALPLRLSAMPLSPERRTALFEGRESFLESIYLGFPVMALALAASMAPARRYRNLLAVVSLLALLVALGHHTPVYGIVAALVPGLGVVRYPIKIVIVVAFGVSLLAGMGLEHVTAAEGRRRKLWTLAGVALGALLVAAMLRSSPELAPAAMGVGCAGAALAVLAGCAARGLSATALVAIGVVDLLVAHRGLNPTMPPQPLAMRPELLDRLEGEPRERFYVIDYQMVGQSQRYLGRQMPFAARSIEGFSREAALTVALREYLAPSTAIGWGVEYGFDLNAQRLYPGWLQRLNALVRETDGTPEWRRLLALGSISHVVSLHEANMDGLTLVGTLGSVLVDPMRVYRVPDPLPRAFGVSGVRVTDDQTAAKTILAADFDPRREVVLLEGTDATPTADFRAEVRVAEKRADRKRLTVDFSHDGFLVMTDTYDPGWRVRVDGRDAALLRANVAFRAVKIPAGRHEVEFVYRPAGWRYGLTAAGLGIVIAAALLTRGRRRPAPAAESPAAPAAASSGGTKAASRRT